MHKAGVIGWHDFVGFATFGSAALIIGSDLPDIDAKTAPINRIFMVLVPGSILLALLYFRIPLIWSLAISATVLLAFVRLMPAHRRFIHTVRAGIVMGGVLALLLAGLLGISFKISLWTGLSLFVGYFIHLWKDRWVIL